MKNKFQFGKYMKVISLVAGSVVVSMTAVTSSGAEKPLEADKNTVLLLHFDEAQGDPKDSSQENASVQNTGATWVMPGRFGWAMGFDGTGKHLKVKAEGVRSLSAITFEAWVQCESDDVGTIVCIGDSKPGTFWLRAEKGAISLLISKEGGEYASWGGGKALLEDGWHQVKVVWGKTYNSGRPRIYVDDEKVSNDAGAKWEDDLADAAVVYIGSYIPDYGKYNWQGKIDEVRISNCVREEKPK